MWDKAWGLVHTVLDTATLGVSSRLVPGLGPGAGPSSGGVPSPTKQGPLAREPGPLKPPAGETSHLPHEPEKGLSAESSSPEADSDPRAVDFARLFDLGVSDLILNDKVIHVDKDTGRLYWKLHPTSGPDNCPSPLQVQRPDSGAPHAGPASALASSGPGEAPSAAPTLLEMSLAESRFIREKVKAQYLLSLTQSLTKFIDVYGADDQQFYAVGPEILGALPGHGVPGDAGGHSRGGASSAPLSFTDSLQTIIDPNTILSALQSRVPAPIQGLFTADRLQFIVKNPYLIAAGLLVIDKMKAVMESSRESWRRDKIQGHKELMVGISCFLTVVNGWRDKAGVSTDTLVGDLFETRASQRAKDAESAESLLSNRVEAAKSAASTEPAQSVAPAKSDKPTETVEPAAGAEPSSSKPVPADSRTAVPLPPPPPPPPPPAPSTTAPVTASPAASLSSLICHNPPSLRAAPHTARAAEPPGPPMALDLAAAVSTMFDSVTHEPLLRKTDIPKTPGGTPQKGGHVPNDAEGLFGGSAFGGPAAVPDRHDSPQDVLLKSMRDKFKALRSESDSDDEPGSARLPGAA